MAFKFFITCDDAHVLSTRDQYKDLNAKEHFRLNLHKTHCNGCRNFHKTNDLFTKKMNHLKWIKLTDEQKQSIKDRLKKELGR